jgi:hypothetical protein
MTTVDLTSRPDIPIALASTSSALSMIAEIGCLIPRLCTV